MRNLQCRFVLGSSIGQIYIGDFAKFCGLLSIYELYPIYEGLTSLIDSNQNKNWSYTTWKVSKSISAWFKKKNKQYFLIFLLFSMYLLDGNVMKVSKFSRTAFFYFGKLLKRQFLGKQILWTCFPVFHSFLRFLLNLSLIEISNRKHTKHKSW